MPRCIIKTSQAGKCAKPQLRKKKYPVKVMKGEEREGPLPVASIFLSSCFSRAPFLSGS